MAAAEHFCDGAGTARRGTWVIEESSGSASLVLKLCGGVLLEPGHEYAFWFHVRNPTGDQSAPDLVMGAAIGSWCEAHRIRIEKPSCTCSAGGPLFGVDGGADVLRVVAPKFETMTVQQSTAVAGATNTIVVVLDSNVDLSFRSNSTLVLRGLALAVGSVFPSTSTVRLNVVGADDRNPRNGILCDDNNEPDAATWDEGAGTLTVFLCVDAVFEAKDAYAIEFNITNPIYKADAASLSVETTGTVRIMPTVLQPQQLSADQLLVVAPVFTRKEMWQASPVAGAANTLSLELSSSVEVSREVLSSLTISGLAGAEPLWIDGSSVGVRSSLDGMTQDGVVMEAGLCWSSDGGGSYFALNSSIVVVGVGEEEM
ncbi:hypothetical protein T484DRAFT_1819995, partial [Baffinella frigidus]